MGKYQVHRSDANAKAIISTWRQAGASVAMIGRPLDVLVGWRGVNYLCEIKSSASQLLRPSQQRFFRTWQGQATIIRSVSDAIGLIRERDVYD